MWLIGSVAALAIAAMTVIAWFLAVFHLLFTQRFQAFFRTIALIGRSLLQHFINDRVVAIETFGLEVRTFIPIQI
ncbi:hypothetical protein D3C81_2021570 [compost metagenome]